MKREASRARSIDLYGVTLLKSGDEAGARRCFGQAQAIIESAYGPISPHLAMIFSHQGDVLRLCTRDPAGARLRYLKALALLQHVHGLAHPDVVGVMANIGYTLIAEKQLGKARVWFERAAVVGRWAGDRDSPVLIIPDLLRASAGHWTSPEAYEEELRRGQARLTRIYGSETAPARDAQHYLRDYQESPGRYELLHGVKPAAILSMPVIGIILAISYYAWTLNGSASPARSELLPFLIAAEVVITLATCLQVWMLRRARNGRPVGSVHGAEQELKEFGSIKGYPLGFALSPFRQAARVGDAFARIAQADIHLMTERYAKATADLTRILATRPGQPPILRRRALAYLGAGEPELTTRAISDLEEAIAGEPGSRFSHLLLSKAFNSLGRGVDAIAAASRALSSGEDDAEARYQRGVGHMTEGDYAEATADLTRALDLRHEPRQPALVLRGQAHLKLGRHGEAIADLSEALELSPENAQLLVLRGAGYRLAGEHERSIADLTRAIELNPELSQAYGQRSRAYRAMGQLDVALADITRAIALCGLGPAESEDAAELIAERRHICREMKMAGPADAEAARDRQGWANPRGSAARAENEEG